MGSQGSGRCARNQMKNPVPTYLDFSDHSMRSNLKVSFRKGNPAKCHIPHLLKETLNECKLFQSFEGESQRPESWKLLLG